MLYLRGASCGPLTSYLAKQLGDCHHPDTDLQREHVERLATALRYERLAEGVLGEPDTRPPAYVKLNRFHLACQGYGAVALLPATGTPALPGQPIAFTAVQPPRGQRVPLPEAFRRDGRLHHSIGGWDEQSAVPPLDFAPGAGGCSVLGGAHIRMLHASLLRLVHLLAWCLKSGPGDWRVSRVAPIILAAAGRIALAPTGEVWLSAVLGGVNPVSGSEGEVGSCGSCSCS
jgi:hypothetical protein